MAIGKISMRVLAGAWLAVRRGWEDVGNCQGQKDIKLQFEQADKQRIGDLFGRIVN